MANYAQPPSMSKGVIDEQSWANAGRGRISGIDDGLVSVAGRGMGPTDTIGWRVITEDTLGRPRYRRPVEQFHRDSTGTSSASSTPTWARACATTSS